MITKISVTNSATLVSAARSRSVFVLQNQSDTDIYFAFDGTATPTLDSGATPGIRLSPGESFSVDGGGNDRVLLSCPIYAIHGGTGNKSLVIHEL